MSDTTKLIDLVSSTIKGHKSHWQETITQRDRDELLEAVAAHVVSKMEDFFFGSITERANHAYTRRGFATRPDFRPPPKEGV